MRVGTVDHGPRFGALGEGAVHMCVDMQNMFAARTAWHTPWMMRVLPNVERIVRADPARTVFTCSVPARNADAATSTWRPYNRRWHRMTLDELDPAMVEFVPPLGDDLPLAEVFDKTTYAPWIHGVLDRRLSNRGVDTLVVTGGEPTSAC